MEFWLQIKLISGPDGKPTAVDHVLELVENHAANIKGLQPESGSDSDDWIDSHYNCRYLLKEIHLSLNSKMDIIYFAFVMSVHVFSKIKTTIDKTEMLFWLINDKFLVLKSFLLCMIWWYVMRYLESYYVIHNLFISFMNVLIYFHWWKYSINCKNGESRMKEYLAIFWNTLILCYFRFNFTRVLI